MSTKEKWLTVVIALCVGGLVFLISGSPPSEPRTVSVYKDGVALQVATPSNYYLPEGTIIHKDYGKGWKCVEFSGNFILMRQAGSSSLAVKVDSCAPLKTGAIDADEVQHLVMPFITWGPDL